MPSRQTLVALCAVLALASPALAQAGARNTNPWVATLISILLVIAVCVASFMSSKRGHQD